MSDDTSRRPRVRPNPDLVAATTVSKSVPPQLRPFKTGAEWTGNKRGRPPGSSFLRYIGGPPVSEQIAQRLRDLTLGDDIPTALKAGAIIGPLLYPRAKAEPIGERITLPALATATDVIVAMSTVIGATTEGRISLEEGIALCTMLGTMRQQIDAVLFEQRLKSIEENLQNVSQQAAPLNGSRGSDRIRLVPRSTGSD
jgi:hypothetical protein